jgi:capsid protein
MFSRWFGKSLFAKTQRQPALPAVKVVRPALMSFDAAQTTPDNRRHWIGADNLSARASHSPWVRNILRSRARHETANNSYARGMAKTLANEVIGRGPRLQMGLDDAEANRTIERQFQTWMREVRLARKLRTARKAIWSDGESFLLLTTNPRHKRTPVQLDLSLVEADRCATPDLFQESKNQVDGIVFDGFGNPLEYHFLKDHPGDPVRRTLLEYDRVDAEFVIHLFDPDRAEQVRGVPESTAAVAVFARLRDYCVSVMEAAKLAANHGGMLETTLPPDGMADDLAPEETIEPQLNEYVSIPAGWKAVQMKAEQPTTTFGDFKGEGLDEAGRGVCMPSNIVRGNSSQYNYASGRLDHQGFFKAVMIEQGDLFELDAMDVVLDAYFQEAVGIPGYVPFPLEQLRAAPHSWIWPGTEHVDPNKEATADEVDLRNGVTTRKILAAKRGLDWETDIAPDLEKENEFMRRVQLATPGAPAPGGQQPVDDNATEVTDG